MAHFAKLDENNIVISVHVVNNAELLDENNVEQEANGIAFLSALHNHASWKQTSYNGNMRKNFAGIGFVYDAERDAFIPPQPFPSWLLSEETCLWNAPVVMPNDGGLYAWNEDEQSWDAVAPLSGNAD